MGLIDSSAFDMPTTSVDSPVLLSVLNTLCMTGFLISASINNTRLDDACANARDVFAEVVDLPSLGFGLEITNARFPVVARENMIFVRMDL